MAGQLVHGNAVAGAARREALLLRGSCDHFLLLATINTKSVFSGILQLTLWYRCFTREDACVLSGEEEWSEGGKDLLTVWLCFQSS